LKNTHAVIQSIQLWALLVRQHCRIWYEAGQSRASRAFNTGAKTDWRKPRTSENTALVRRFVYTTG